LIVESESDLSNVDLLVTRTFPGSIISLVFHFG
jgi:hypothetical protein